MYVHSFWPWGAATHGDGLFDGWTRVELALQVVLTPEKVEQVAEKVVEYVRLVALTHGSDVDCSLRKLQTQPLRGKDR